MAAPHVAAPHVAVPHVAAPRIAAPGVTRAAPHVYAPHAHVYAPRAMAPRMASPRSNVPHIATSHGGLGLRSLGRASGHASAVTRAHALPHTQAPSRAALARTRPGFAQQLQHPGIAARSRLPVGGRALGTAGLERLSRQSAMHAPGGRRVGPMGVNGFGRNRHVALGVYGHFVRPPGHAFARFDRHNRDFARRRFHAGFVGWVGPVFWPYADYDIIDYSVWPYDYGDVFWSYGPDDIADAVFWPYGTEDLGAYTEVLPGGTSRHGRRHATRAARTPVSRTDLSEVCGAGDARGIADWPIRQIGEVVQPDEAQGAALDELTRATLEASKVIREACPRQPPATPAGRLGVMESRLEAMRHAVDIVRPALKKFYDLLSDEQKARFNALAAPRSDAERAALARDCADEAARVAQWPVDQIDRVVRPTTAQRQSLDDLRVAIAQSADQLKGSCPAELAATPPGRLDQVARRIDALRSAVTGIREKLEQFYGSLDDEQKARFNTIGTAGRSQS
jgi:hypothetical protein